MEKITYIPQEVCSSQIIFQIDDNIIKDLKVIGGCPGNSLGVSSLCKNQSIDDIINKLSGIKCGFKNTSCPDQIAKALKEYKDNKVKSMN